MKKTYSLILIASLFVSLSHCTSVHIPTAPTHPSIYRLANHSRFKTRFRISDLETPSCTTDCFLGFQTLLLFPIGKAKILNKSELLYNAFYEALVLKNIEPILDSDFNRELPLFQINLMNMSQNTYDLLITRKVSSSLSFSVTITKGGSIQELPTVVHERSSYYKFPGGKELSYELSELIKEALLKIEGFKM